MKLKLAGLFTAILLAGCGGTTSNNSSPAAETKLTPHAKTAVTAASYADVVQSLYIAYFGRPADPTGLANFEAALMSGGAPTDISDLNNAYATNTEVNKLVNSFQTSAESQALYGASSTKDFVTAIYANVLGRAPDSDGQTFWVNAIDGNKLTRGDAALSIMNGAANNTSGTAQGAIDQQLVNNRLAVAGSFTSQVSAQNAVSAYAGDAAAAAARAMLSLVNSTTTVAVFDNYAAAAVTGLVYNVNVAGSTGAYSANNFLTFNNNANGDVLLDAAGSQYAVDATSWTLVALLPQQSLNGLLVTTAGEIVFNGNVVGYIGLVQSGSGYIARIYYTADGLYGTGSLAVASGSYTFGCTSSCTSNSGTGSPTALEMIDTQLGTGATATVGSTVTVAYAGWLLDGTSATLEGTEFDASSLHSPGTFSFTLNGGSVIEGWDQGVVGMKVGGVRTLIIPSSLGYGANANGSIPANSPLIFQVQLLDVQ